MRRYPDLSNPQKQGKGVGPSKMEGTPRYGFALTEGMWKALIVALSGSVLLLTVYCLSHGITIVFMHLYYIPIVLLAYHYRRWGLLGIILLSAAYLALVAAYDWGQWMVIDSAIIRVVVFIGIGVLVVYLSEHLVQAREELKQSLEIQTSIIENANVWMMVLDNRGTILEWNTAAEGMSGYSAAEVKGSADIWKRLYPEREYRREITTRITDIIRKNRYLENLKTTITCKDGSRKVMLWNTKALSLETEDPRRFIAIGIDITDRAKAEEKLEASEKRYRDLVENIDEVIYLRDREGIITYISPVVEKIFGYLSSEVQGRRIEEFIYEMNPDEVENVKSSSNRGKRESYQVRIVDKKGNVRWVNISVSPVVEGGTCTAVRGVISEITSQKEAEYALRESRRLLENILNTITARVFWKDKNLVYLGCNAAFARDAGYQKPEDIIGKDDYAMAWRDLAEFYRADDRAVIEQNQPKILFEEPLKDSTGEMRWLLTNKIPLLDEKGEVMGVLGTYFDITSRKKAEEALRKSELRNTLLLEAIPDLMFIISRDGEYRDFKVPDEAMLALPVDQIRGKNIRDTGFRQDTTEMILHTIDRAIDTGQLQKCEYDLSLPVGIRHYEARMVALNQDEVLAIVRDVSDQKALQEALRASEEKYRLLIEKADEGVWMVDRDYRTTFVNPHLGEMLGYSPEEMLGRQVIEFMPASYREVHLKRVRERLAGKSERFEQQFIRKDGSTIWVSASTSPIIKNGEIVGAFSLLTDITSRKKAEELQKHFTEELEQQVIARTEALNASLKEKVVLLREVHHRVKNNLQIIISLMNLQMRKADDPRLKELLLEAQDRVRTMSLVHEKLYQSEDLSRINLSSYLHSLGTQLISSHGDIGRKITLRMELDPILTDINIAIPLGLVVNELVSNSLKHAFPGEMKGNVTIRGKSENGDIVVSVDDDGIGIPPNFDWSTAPTLGLYLVPTLVRQINGRIERVSVERGTKYCIIIPAARRREET
ncbi:MAG TPA: PAS domain S-box protein [Methanolinea sp.]|nr:PAS domain S-box protein [Methanolinea sp.]HQK55466.1 PAS domain S-box protein [Methanolinea sp.]